MPVLDIVKFKNEIKELIIKECELKITASDIKDNKPLFGSDSDLELDSLDALQISVAIQKVYGISITDSKEMRRVSKSFDGFIEYLSKNIKEK